VGGVCVSREGGGQGGGGKGGDGGLGGRCGGTGCAHRKKRDLGTDRKGGQGDRKRGVGGGK